MRTNFLRQISFCISEQLDEDFRKKAGQVYGARKNAIGLALRDAIHQFLVSNETSNQISPPEKEVL
jgi:hypothetical protein